VLGGDGLDDLAGELARGLLELLLLVGELEADALAGDDLGPGLDAAADDGGGRPGGGRLHQLQAFLSQHMRHVG